MIIACGIDPAKRYGIAVIRYPGDEVLYFYQGHDWQHGREALRNFSCAESVLAVENQYVDPKHKATAIKVAHRAGEWAGIARVFGWPKADYVQIQTWRSAYKRTGRVKGGKRWAKGDAVIWANTLFRLDLKPTEHDVAEALLIARWAAVRAHTRGLG